jgi:hypothetical protein
MLIEVWAKALVGAATVVVAASRNLRSSLSKSSSVANEAAAMSERQTRSLKFILNINEILNYKLGPMKNLNFISSQYFLLTTTFVRF